MLGSGHKELLSVLRDVKETVTERERERDALGAGREKEGERVCV